MRSNTERNPMDTRASGNPLGLDRTRMRSIGPSNLSIRGFPNPTPARARTARRAPRGRFRPSLPDCRPPKTAFPAQVRTDSRVGHGRDHGEHRLLCEKRRAPGENRCNSSRSTCRPRERRVRDRTRHEPWAHGVDTAGRHGDRPDTWGTVRRDGWASALRAANRRTASTRACPPCSSRHRCSSMIESQCTGACPRIVSVRQRNACEGCRPRRRRSASR